MSSNSASGGASTGSGSNNTPAGGGHQPHYPQANSLVFVVNPLPSSEEQLNERILDAAEKLRNQASNNTTTTGSSSQPSAVQNNGSNPTTNIPVISFNRDDVSVPNGNQEQLSVLCNPPRSSIDSQNEQQQQQTSTNAEPNRVNVLQCVISSGHVAVLLEDNRICRFPYNIYPERISSANGGEASSSTKSTLSTPSHRPLNSPSSSSLVSSSSARTVQTARRRLIRSSSRPRTSASVIMGRGHVIPAQFVPEDLINQAQVVLQGKSRNVIIRELQRTNLDVNLAVNNLLSRDDEEFDDAEDGPEQMIQSDDLMSLLDSGFPNESVIIDSDFADEVFSYPLRIRSSSALFNNSGSAGSGSGAAGSGSGAAAGGGTGSGGSSSSSRPSRLRDDAFSFIERDLQLSSGSGTKSRWYSYNSENSKADALAGSSRSSKSNLKTSDTTLQLAPISFYEQQQEFWPNASDKKFVAIASIYSELIAITAQGQLCQWRWQDVEPFKGQLSDGTVYYHPKVPSLGLLQEKVNLLSASCIRATVATESGKLATWIDESISPIASKLEHAATSSIFAESAQSGPSTAATSNISPPPKIALLYVSSLMSCVQLSTGALYWWGIPPFSYRKKLVEKVKNERNKPSKSKSNNASGGTSSATAGGVSGTSVPATSNIKENTDIVQGALVCMRNSPIYQNGSIAFTTVGGVPKVGQLVNSAWKMTDCCSFRVLSHAEIQSRLQPSGGSVLSLNQRTIKDSLSVDSKCEMPPPPSPASSTSSDPGYNPPLPKRAKRSSNSGSGSAAGGSGQSGGSASDQAKQEQVLLGANIIERVESWNLKDVVFMEDVKSMPIGRVIKVDGNYVAVKFSHGMINESQQQQGVAKGSGSSGTAFDFSFENYIQDCRLMRKDELAVMKSSPTLGQVQSTAPSTCPASNSYGTKAYDCLQRYPKRVHIPEHVQIVAMTLTNLGLHCIAKIGGYRFSYILINIVTGRIEQDSKISIEYNTFSGNTSTNPKTSLIRLYSAGETDTTTVVLCRDGNGTLYPLAKDCTESLIREPIALNLGPVSTIGLGIYALPSAITNAAANANSGSGAPGSGSSSAPKTHAAILGLAFEPQLLMSAILKSDLDLVRERLDMLERYPHIYHPMIGELCDGNHNIIHIAASACSPTTNKLNGQTTSSATGNILNMFDSDEILTIERSPEPFISSVSNDQPMECNFDTTAEPLLDPNEQKPIAHSILWTLLDSKVLFGHLLDLLSARDFNGHTPFMLAIAGRAYSAANQLFIWCQKIAHHYTVATCPIGSAAYKDQFKRTLMQMVYPRGSLPDHSPLYMLCSNDTCSFTWTGEEHINQDIFECRTCGLVGSLCCCTECARVCHRGHDCKLKRTSPTAYCDCWEKCKCKALISGCQPARYELLRKLLAHTDLSLRVNSRGEHIMLYLVQTVGRQIIEQKQYRPSRLRASNSSSRNKTETNEEGTATVPEHDLEPPKFARRALEKFINDWPTVKSMILTGYRAPENNNQQHKRRSYLCGFFNGTSNAYAYEEENAYLARQNGSALLDKFTHSLLRIGLDMIEKLIVTLLMACNNQFPEARAVTRRFVRSVARVGLVVCFELNPTLYASLAPMSGLVSLIERALGGNGSSGASGTYSSSSALSKKTSALSILSKCRRIFLSFLPIAIEELCEIAESLIAPVKLGIARPSGPFVLSPTSTEVLASTDEIFSVDTSIYAHQRDFLDSAFGLEVHEEPGSQHAPPPPPPVVVPAPIPAVSQENLIVPNVVANNFAGAFDAPMGVNVDHIDARNGPIADEVIIRNDLAIEPMDTSSGVGPSNGSVSIDQIAGPSSGSAPENGADVIVASNEDISSEPPPSIDSDEPFHRRDDMVIIGEMLVGSEHDEDNSNVGGRDSESDSESNPDDASYLSNADNASMAQRSVVTGATAGSDVGVSSLPYDDESVNSNGEDVDDDDDDDGEADDNDDDDDDNSDASDTAETEPEQEDIPFLDDQVDRPLRGSSSSNFGPNSALVNGLASIGSHNSRRDNILHHVQWALRQRDINGGASGSAAAASASQDSGFRRAAISNVLVAGDNVVSMSNSSVGLARAFSIVIRQIGDLMPILRDPHELNTSGFMHLPFTPAEALALQQTVEDRLRNTWDWLINIMDSTETQLRFGCALSNRRLTSTVSSSLSSSTSSSAQAAASISNAVAFSTTGVTSASNTAASNSLRRLRAFQNHDDMLFLPSLSRTTSALRRMSGLGLGRASSSSANGAAGASSGAGAGSSAAGSGSSGAAPSSSLSMDSNFARRDFLNYAMSLMRAHSNEHYDSLPVLDVSSLKHLAYAFDAFIYYIRRGLVTSYQQQQQQTPTEESQEYALEQSIVTEADGSECSEKSSDVPSGRSSRFFRRSNSTLFLGCPPPDPFSAPFHEALPLASKPHLLQPNARREQLFGVPRPSNSTQAEEMIESLPSQMGLTKRQSQINKQTPSTPAPNVNTQTQPSHHHNLSTPMTTLQVPQRNQSVIAENSTSPSRSSIIQITPTKASVIVLAGSAKHQATTATTQTTASSHEPETKNNMCSVISKGVTSITVNTVLPTKSTANISIVDNSKVYANFYYGNQEKHDSLLGRWRLSLELFGRLFVDDVGLEPSSIMTELSGFPVKETKFRREMERLRNPNSSSSSSSSSQRDISFLKLDRERGLMLQQTFKELNSVFSQHSRRLSSSSSSSQHLAITRVKVTFKDEPGEGSGVARSFYTAFSEAALANEKLPSLDWLVASSNSTSSGRGGSSNSFSTSGGSSPYHNFQYNMIRVANANSISAAVANVLANGGSSGGGASGNGSSSQRSVADDSLRRPRSPSRLRLFTSRRSHLERFRNELRAQNAFGPGGSGSSGSSGAGGSGSGSSSGLGPSGSSSGSSRSRNSSGPILRYESAPFVPTQYVSLSTRFASSSPVISSDSRITLGHRIYGRVYPLQPNHAPKITGMLLDLPSHDLIPILTSDEEFRNQVEQAVDIINTNERINAAVNNLPPGVVEVVVPPEQIAASVQESSAQNYKTSSSGSGAVASGSVNTNETELPDEEDNAPLFYQPGPRGFYSPRAGRCTEARLNAFRNVGRIMGICFVQNELCPITFNRHVIKVVLGRPVSWHDLAFFDSDLYESLRQLILDAESTNKEEIFAELDFRFSIDVTPEEGGQEVELVPNGRNIRVTPANVFNYVRLYALYRMVISQLPAIQALRTGIFDVLPAKSFDGLTTEDFRLLLNGVNEINVQLLQSYVTFHDESGDGSEHLSYFRRWFWWVVERMNNEEKQDLIYFWTGSPALPASEEGFQPMPSITIRPRDDFYFVTANTCISRLYIPLYSSRNILRQKLLISIKAKSFGFI